MKIIQAVNAMINKSSLITNIVRDNYDANRYFFKFNERYYWSISFAGAYNVTLYPNNQLPVEELAQTAAVRYLPIVSYNTNELSSSEAYQTFSDLYRIVAEKVLGIDSILDDILNS